MQPVPPSAAPGAPAFAQPPEAEPSDSRALKTLVVVLAAAVALGILTVVLMLVAPCDGEPPIPPSVATSTPEASATAEATTTTGTAPTVPAGTGAKKPVGYSSADKAVKAYLDIDWSYALLADYGKTVDFATAPPESDYTEVVIVTKQSDGSWKVSGTRAIGPGEMGQSEGIPIDDEAEFIVHQHLQALIHKDYEDARSMCVGSATSRVDDAWVRNGTLTTYKVNTVIMSNDGSTVRLEVNESWDFGNWWSNPDNTYTCVPTPNGYRISDVATP